MSVRCFEGKRKEEREGEDILVSFEGFKRFRFLGGALWVMAKERGSGGVGLGLGDPCGGGAGGWLLGGWGRGGESG